MLPRTLGFCSCCPCAGLLRSSLMRSLCRVAGPPWSPSCSLMAPSPTPTWLWTPPYAPCLDTSACLGFSVAGRSFLSSLCGPFMHLDFTQCCRFQKRSKTVASSKFLRVWRCALLAVDPSGDVAGAGVFRARLGSRGPASRARLPRWAVRFSVPSPEAPADFPERGPRWRLYCGNRCHHVPARLTASVDTSGLGTALPGTVSSLRREPAPGSSRVQDASGPGSATCRLAPGPWVGSTTPPRVTRIGADSPGT